MKPTLKPKPSLPEFIDSSALTSFRSCKKKFWYSTLQKIKPTGESIHLAAGGAIAAALEASRIAQFYKYPDRRLSVDELLSAALPAYLRLWNNYHPDEEQTKNQHNVFHALEYYFHEIHPFDDPVQPFIKSDGKPTVEYTFAVPLPINHPETGTPFTFVGRFDMLGEYMGLPVVFDDKTTSALGPQWQRQWALRGQFLGYVWACQQLGHSIDHAIVRGLAIQKTQHQILTVPVQYPQHLIDRWYKELLQTIHEMIHSWQNDYFPYDFADACTSYGGCPFADLCLAADPEPWLTNYEENTWSPIELASAA